MAKDKVFEIDKESIQEGLIAKFSQKACEGSFEIYLLICAYSEDNHYAQVSIKTLRQKSGYSLRRICRCIDALEEAKFIRKLRKGQGGKPQFYEVTRTLK